jgi:hypothetical protein
VCFVFPLVVWLLAHFVSLDRARSMFYTGRSDLLSDVKAFDACLAARNEGHSSLRNFAEDVRPFVVSSLDPSSLLCTLLQQNFISLSTFRDVLNLRNEYLTALSDVGFVPFRASSSSPSLNENASKEHLLKAIIFAGTGRLVKVKLPPALFDKGSSGAIERDRVSREVKFFEKDGEWVFPGALVVRSDSLSGNRSSFPSSWISPLHRDAVRHALLDLLFETRYDEALPARRDRGTALRLFSFPTPSLTTLLSFSKGPTLWRPPLRWQSQRRARQGRDRRRRRMGHDARLASHRRARQQSAETV